MSYKTVSLILLLLNPIAVFAANSSGQTGIGDVAVNMLGAAVGIRDLVHIVCLLTACALLMGSIMLFVQHWKNPVQVPLSKPIMMVVAAAALITLTFIPMAI